MITQKICRGQSSGEKFFMQPDDLNPNLYVMFHTCP
jgi:hypothetical protein